jgi:hypothetical protein
VFWQTKVVWLQLQPDGQTAQFWPPKPHELDIAFPGNVRHCPCAQHPVEHVALLHDPAPPAVPPPVKPPAVPPPVKPPALPPPVKPPALPPPVVPPPVTEPPEVTKPPPAPVGFELMHEPKAHDSDKPHALHTSPPRPQAWLVPMEMHAPLESQQPLQVDDVQSCFDGPQLVARTPPVMKPKTSTHEGLSRMAHAPAMDRLGSARLAQPNERQGVKRSPVPVLTVIP